MALRLLSNLVKQLEAGSRRDARMAHLNVRSLRNKIDELRCLQLLCRFEILAITETHLDKSVTDSAIDIPVKFPYWGVLLLSHTN